MARSELSAGILQLMQDRAAVGDVDVPRRSIVEALGVPSATAGRYLSRLVAEGKIERLGDGAAVRYRLPQGRLSPGRSEPVVQPVGSAALTWSVAARSLMAKLDEPLGQRAPVTYRRAFVDDYEPNKNFLLPESLAHDLLREGQMHGQQPAGTYARNVITPLLLDLSFSSSKLEGNRYSMLDTVALFETGKADPGDKDATMLLNHKQAIEFLIDEVPLIGLTAPVVRNVHTLLMQGLLNNEDALGTIRKTMVRITNTVYTPTHAPQLLEEMLSRIVLKANAIRNPVEAAFFLWVNIAYLQPFEDGNKRTSRLSANIPLLLYNCAPLSFLDVSNDDYSRARIGVYEQLDTSIAADLFAWTYRRSIAKYAVMIEAAGKPDPFRATYRETINVVVARVVRDRKALSEAIDEADVAPADVAQFRGMVETDLAKLGEHNFSRYRVTMREFNQWSADGRPLGN